MAEGLPQNARQARDALTPHSSPGRFSLGVYKASAIQLRNQRAISGTASRIDRDEARSLQRLADLQAEVREFPVPSGSAQRELNIAERVLVERRELAITAARISPPPYIAKELGERPSGPTKRRAWDRGVTEIETYRQRYGVKDRSRAFGPESRQAAERSRQERARQQLLQTQRLLGLRQHRERARALRRGLRLFR